jgi:hypothetical protein
MRNLAAEFGVDVDDRGSKVFDHFNYAIVDDKEDHTLIAASDLVDAHIMVGGPYKVGRRAARQTKPVPGDPVLTLGCDKGCTLAAPGCPSLTVRRPSPPRSLCCSVALHPPYLPTLSW